MRDGQTILLWQSWVGKLTMFLLCDWWKIQLRAWMVAHATVSDWLFQWATKMSQVHWKTAKYYTQLKYDVNEKSIAYS